MAEQEQNRTEPATAFKLAEARKQGQVAKSLDFNSFIQICALLLSLLTLGAGVAQRLASVVAWLLSQSGALRLESPDDAAWIGGVLMQWIGIVTPFALVGLGGAILANIVQTGPIFTLVPLKPKFERLNPVAGFKRAFNKRM